MEHDADDCLDSASLIDGAKAIGSRHCGHHWTIQQGVAGSILAATGITFGTGADSHGCALAQHAVAPNLPSDTRAPVDSL
jgi:hypothetical protein